MSLRVMWLLIKNDKISENLRTLSDIYILLLNFTYDSGEIFENYMQNCLFQNFFSDW